MKSLGSFPTAPGVHLPQPGQMLTRTASGIVPIGPGTEGQSPVVNSDGIPEFTAPGGYTRTSVQSDLVIVSSTVFTASDAQVEFTPGFYRYRGVANIYVDATPLSNIVIGFVEVAGTIDNRSALVRHNGGTGFQLTAVNPVAGSQVSPFVTELVERYFYFDGVFEVSSNVTLALGLRVSTSITSGVHLRAGSYFEHRSLL